MLLHVFRYLVAADTVLEDTIDFEETASPLVLERIRLVSRRWKTIVDNHCRGCFLIATPGFMVQDFADDPPAWSRLFDAWYKNNDIGSSLDTVSFHLCDRLASPRLMLNVDHARIFTGALTKCKTARDRKSVV